MTTDNTLESIDFQLQKYVDAIREQDQKEIELNAQITALRLEIARIKDNRYDIKQKIYVAQKERESALRKHELAIEADRIRKTLEEKRKEAEEILASAPWINDAFQWQIDGALSLPERALLGDKRGLGKTLSSLIWRRLQKSKKTLICLRREVAHDFLKELSIREPDLLVYSMLGATSETRKIAAMLLNSQEEFVVVTNIESWRRNIDQTTEDILKIKYDAIILDEAHHIKNSGTGTARGFFKLVDEIPKVLELTGTPIKNRPQEMFSLLHALYPDQFQKETHFLRDYCTQIGQNKWVFTPAGLKSLVAKISHFYVARSPEDIGRLIPPPRMVEYKLSFENHEAQKEAYKMMTERSVAMLNSGKVIPIVSQLAIMTRQAQMVSWPAGINFVDPETDEIIKFDIHESVKMDWAEDLIRELIEEGERVIMFSRFKPAIYELQRRLADLSVAVITGDSKFNRKEVFDDFDLKTASKDEYKYNALLATYQTVGESANFNAAGHMVLYDRFWNPGNEDQAIGRIDRINSVNQATIHVPLVEETIDIYMTDLIEGKRNIVTEFKDAATMQSSLADHLKSTV